ncbi:aldo/keto reductase [Metabacillus fastidiosus]|uniref:aldo/keto reductase n=1 Tax=Metabacillus fastidiosus TaxID=1458 RepID=UPI002E238AC8|nr:aldo/keto reductase [Metabacillus fastidiosus]
MKYRKLGKTDLDVSVIGLGTWQFGGEWGRDFTQQEVDAIISRSKELGINFIDTAECYGVHVAEKLIGNYIQNDRREDWIIATKFGHYFDNEKFDRFPSWSTEAVLQQLDNSLKALKTDYVDLYQFHSGNNEVFNNDDLWTALDKQVKAGKIRHLGISLSYNEETHVQVEKATDVNASVIQVIYNRIDKTPEEKVFPSCERQNLGVLARVPLASGYLSGKYKPGATFGERDVRRKHDKDEVAEKLRLVEEIRKTEVPEGINMAQWALGWSLQHPAVTSVIPGCKTVEQLEANAAAADLDMVRDDHPQSVQK